MANFYYSWSRQDSPPDFPVESATGDTFILTNGKPVYDFISTSFQANFGHSFEPIQTRISEQLRRLPIASPKSWFATKERASEQLLSLLECGGGKIFYTVSGAESVENALKIARQITGRPIVAARHKSYHGASLGALSVTGDWRNKPHMTCDDWTLRIPEHDQDPELEATRELLEKTGPDRVAAVIVETISGTNGMALPPTEWFDGLKSLCQRFGILLILDEVLVGFGRCGRSFAFHGYGIVPDMICMSKAITGGYFPFGALWTSQSIANYYQDETLACGLTNYGHPIGLAAMQAVIETLTDQEFMTNKLALENCFADLVYQLASLPSVDQVRQRGLMAAFYLNRPAPTWGEAMQQGLHLFSKENLVLLAPPYISSQDRLTAVMQILADLLKSQ